MTRYLAPLLPWLAAFALALFRAPASEAPALVLVAVLAGGGYAGLVREGRRRGHE